MGIVKVYKRNGEWQWTCNHVDAHRNFFLTLKSTKAVGWQENLNEALEHVARVHA